MKRTIPVVASVCCAVVSSAAPIDVGTKLQVMWDNRIVDTNATTAAHVLHHPVYAGVAMEWDRPWEGGGSENPTVIVDADAEGKPLYRLYYLGWDIYRDAFLGANRDVGNRLQNCYAESRDAIHWTRKELGLWEFDGSKKNNIVIGKGMKGWCSNCFFFKDTNPKCPPSERYKAITSRESARCTVNVLVSPDGIHFSYGWPIIQLNERSIMADAHLCAFYHEATGKYHVYIRGHRKVPPEDQKGKPFTDREIRQVLHAEFADLHKMEVPRVVAFTCADGGEPEDYPLYYSNAFTYYRDPSLIVAFPTRYNQRGWWNPTYDYMPDVEYRKARFKRENRFGLAVTDAIFACSRDGQNFFRFDEAFLRPGPERHRGWTYGSCYPGACAIPTPAADGSGEELSIYVPHGHWFQQGVTLERWTIRVDGFASRQAPYRGARVVTRDFVFSGKEMLVNFSTSARGRIAAYLYLAGRKTESLSSTWMFGDRVDTPVTFPADKLAPFAGKPVRLEFAMIDADLYSFRFR